MRCGALVLLLVISSAHALACPVCDRETGRQVRAGLFDENFGFNLLATILPFAVFLGIAGAIHFELPRRKAPAPAPAPASVAGPSPGAT